MSINLIGTDAKQFDRLLSFTQQQAEALPDNMTILIDIDPQMEARLRKKADAKQVPVDSYVREVLKRDSEEEDDETAWQELYKREVNEKIDRGIAQADRGECLTGEQVREWMAEQKAAWRREQLKP